MKLPSQTEVWVGHVVLAQWGLLPSPCPSDARQRCPANHTVVVGDGDLWCHSPFTLSRPLQEEEIHCACSPSTQSIPMVIEELSRGWPGFSRVWVRDEESGPAILFAANASTQLPSERQWALTDSGIRDNVVDWSAPFNCRQPQTPTPSPTPPATARLPAPGSSVIPHNPAANSSAAAPASGSRRS